MFALISPYKILQSSGFCNYVSPLPNFCNIFAYSAQISLSNTECLQIYPSHQIFKIRLASPHKFLQKLGILKICPIPTIVAHFWQGCAKISLLNTACFQIYSTHHLQNLRILQIFLTPPLLPHFSK